MAAIGVFQADNRWILVGAPVGLEGDLWKTCFLWHLSLLSEGPKLGEPGREAWSIWVKAMEIFENQAMV